MSQPTGTVVVGVDGSTSARQALDWAVDQAVVEHRQLTLVHALGEPTSTWTEVALTNPPAAYTALREEGQLVLDEARKHALERAPGLEIRELLEFMDPREMLLEQSRGADLLVVGSRGRGPVRSLLLGSVGVALARHAACPVVVHRPGHRGLVRQGVLVAADGSEDSRPVLEFAYHLASLRDLPLTVMHCFWDVESVTTETYVPTNVVDREAERLELAESLAGMAEKYPDVHVTRTVAHGLPEARVAMAGDRMDVVVLGAHQGSRAQQLVFGSVSLSVVEHATCPVVVVPLSAGS